MGLGEEGRWFGDNMGECEKVMPKRGPKIASLMFL